MRIERLDLAAFGHFTDHTLELGGAGADGVDLHLVYGPNEAGKSTMLAAIGELLYGMPHRSAWAFRHDNAVLEIGARLEDGDGAFEVRRHKNRLVDGDGRALEADAIDTHRLGLDEYRARFSLDEKTLEKGSDAILEQQGELGAALFSAAAGLADLGSRLELAMAPANAFYQPRKRTQIELLALKARLVEIDAELAARDVDTKAWTALRSATDAARERHAHQERLVAELHAGVTALERQLRALSAAERRAGLRVRLDAFDALPELPDEALDAFERELAAHDGARGTFETAEASLAELEKDLAALAIDEPVLARRDAIEALARERVIVAERRREAPAAREALERTEQACRALARRLELADELSPLDAAVPEDVVARLETLAQERSGLIAAREAAAGELAALGDGDAEPDPGRTANEDDAPSPDTTLLARFVEQLVGEAPWVARDALRARRDELAVGVERALEGLAPWRGDERTLTRLTPPEPVELTALEGRATALDAQARTLEQDARRLADDSAAHEDARASLADTGIVDDARLAALRDARDERLAALRDAIGREVAPAALLDELDELETAFATLDAAADARVAHGDALARLRALDGERVTLERRGARAAAAADEHAAAARALETDIAAVATGLGLDGASLPALLAWLPRRANALQRVEELRDVAARLERTQSDLADRAERLAALLAPLLPDTSRAAPAAALAAAPLDELLPLARETLGAHARRRERRERVARERRERAGQRARRRRALDEAEGLLERWRERWEQAVGERPALAGDAAMTIERLDAWRKLGQETRLLDERRTALAALDGALERFERRARDTFAALDGAPVTAPVTAFGPTSLPATSSVASPATPPTAPPDAPSDVGDDDTIARVAALENRLAKAVRAAEAAEAMRAKIVERRRRRDEARETLEPLARRLDALRARARADDLAALPARMARMRERRELRERLAETEDDLRDALATDDVDAALAARETLERDALTADLATRTERLEAERRELAECFATLKSGERELATLDDNAAVATLQAERANVLHEIETRALDTLRLRLGRLALESGLNRFRERHRSGMMEHARRAFVALTDGQFGDLRARPDERGRDRLVGVRTDGSVLDTARLSTGTRLQLFLALRVAAWHEYADKRVPLPFVADDILESFDERRTAAALALMADMARRGQVIYLTHHRHLIDIAREAAPSVRVHELPARASPIADPSIPVGSSPAGDPPAPAPTPRPARATVRASREAS